MPTQTAGERDSLLSSLSSGEARYDSVQAERDAVTRELGDAKTCLEETQAKLKSLGEVLEAVGGERDEIKANLNTLKSELVSCQL